MRFPLLGHARDLNPLEFAHAGQTKGILDFTLGFPSTEEKDSITHDFDQTDWLDRIFVSVL